MSKSLGGIEFGKKSDKNCQRPWNADRKFRPQQCLLLKSMNVWNCSIDMIGNPKF